VSFIDKAIRRRSSGLWRRREFAAADHVYHIVIGGRENSLMRLPLGSVVFRVAAEAPCTISAVRPRRVAWLAGLDETSEKPDEARD
jgi:eukaryotic-like serine/threonine-protein kinase